MRIHIIGGPGSGKTTLAHEISRRFEIPHHDLDQVAMSYGNRRDEYIRDAQDIAAQEQWVSEGIFLIWTEPLLYRADTIAFLEIPWYTAVWRVLRRHFVKTLQGNNPHPTRLLLPFLKFTREYYTAPAFPAGKEENLRKFLEAVRRQEGPPDSAMLAEQMDHSGKDAPLCASFTWMYLEKYATKLSVVRGSSDQKELWRRLEKMRNA